MLCLFSMYAIFSDYSTTFLFEFHFMFNVIMFTLFMLFLSITIFVVFLLMFVAGSHLAGDKPLALALAGKRDPFAGAHILLQFNIHC